MSTSSLVSLSNTALYISFFIYLIAIIPLGLSVGSKRKWFFKTRNNINIGRFYFANRLFYFKMVRCWTCPSQQPV